MTSSVIILSPTGFGGDTLSRFFLVEGIPGVDVAVRVFSSNGL